MLAAEPCPDGCLPVGLPPSLAGEGRAGACSLPDSHSQMLTSADATGASLSAPADLGVFAVCIYWGGGIGRIWESLSQGAGHPRPALFSHIYPANCLPDTGSLVPLPDLQGPFHPVPSPACLSGQARCIPCVPASWAFTDPSIFQALEYTPAGLPSLASPWSPCLVPEPQLHARPHTDNLHCILSPAALRRANANPLLQMGKLRQERQAIAQGYFMRLGCRDSNPVLPDWEAHLKPGCSTSLPGPPPPWTNHPLDFCGRHILSAAFHPKLPGSLFSAHVAPPLMGILPAKAWVLPRLPWDRSTNGVLGRRRGPGGICARNSHSVHAALAFKDHWGLQRLGLLDEGFQGVCSQEGVSHVGFLDLIYSGPRARRCAGATLGLCQAPLLLRAQQKGTGEKQGVRLVWLVTNTPGLLPVCPPGGPRGACGLLAPALPALCPAHPCILASSQLLLFLGVYISGLGDQERWNPVRPKAGLPGSWWVLGAKGGNEVEAASLCGDNVNPCLSGQEEGMDEECKGALAEVWGGPGQKETVLGKRWPMPHSLASCPSSYLLFLPGPVWGSSFWGLAQTGQGLGI